MSHAHEPAAGALAAPRSRRLRKHGWLAALAWLAACACFTLVWRRAWICDDAFITLRALDNLVTGHGLVSNPPERVLGFTHPLWALLLLLPRAAGIDGYWAAMGTSLLLSLGCALWVATRAAASWAAGVLAAAWLAGSLAFVDFSTGGLENPLAHLLLAVFFTGVARERPAVTAAPTWLLAALIVLNRHDHALLVLPVLAACATAKPAREFAPALLWGALPLVGWFAFALVYYGFALPNAVHAKLNTELPAQVLLAQGGRYFADAWQRDPQTLVVIALGLLVMARERSRAALGTGVGLVLYLAYVLRIGGDFMTGRFFSAPLVVSVVWLAARGLRGAAPPTLVGLAVVHAALVALHPTSLSASVDEPSCTIDLNGIVIERQCYAQLTGLSRNLDGPLYEHSPRFARGRRLAREHQRVVKVWNVGLTGYAAGPDVHVIDVLALTDPLLARLTHRADGLFRIGHFERAVPDGYRETLTTGRNQLADPCLHAYYDLLWRVIRGPLFTRARWQAIAALHFGGSDRLLQTPCRLRGRPDAASP